VPIHVRTSTGGAFDDKQLQQADASPDAIESRHSRIICSFSSRASEIEAFLWLSFFREVKRPHALALKENEHLESQKKIELFVLALLA
jgi:hypothetical protein